MTVQEQVAPKEVLSPAELGEKAHGEIIRIINGLRATPEASAAIFNHFFFPPVGFKNFVKSR